MTIRKALLVSAAVAVTTLIVEEQAPKLEIYYSLKPARWILPEGCNAVNVRGHVFTYQDSLDAKALRHEEIHSEQWRRYGTVGFLARYLWFHLQYGYEMNPFEVEARAESAMEAD